MFKNNSCDMIIEVVNECIIFQEGLLD